MVGIREISSSPFKDTKEGVGIANQEGSGWILFVYILPSPWIFLFIFTYTLDLPSPWIPVILKTHLKSRSFKNTLLVHIVYIHANVKYLLPHFNYLYRSVDEKGAVKVTEL